jgi:hypothetical protein
MGDLSIDPLAASGDPMQRLMSRVAALEALAARPSQGAAQRQIYQATGVSIGANATSTVATFTFQTSAPNTLLKFYGEVQLTVTSGVAGMGGIVNLVPNGGSALTALRRNTNSNLSASWHRFEPIIADSTSASTQSIPSAAGTELTVLLPTAGTNTVAIQLGAFAGGATFDSVYITGHIGS